MPDALSAKAGVDFINELALIDGGVGAGGFTHVAIDAFFSDFECHGINPVVVF